MTNRPVSAKIGQLLRPDQQTMQRLKQTNQEVKHRPLGAAPGGGPGYQTAAPSASEQPDTPGFSDALFGGRRKLPANKAKL